MCECPDCRDERNEAAVKLIAVCEALKAITMRMQSGEWCFKTAKGIPMRMDAKKERLVRKAQHLIGGKA